MNHQQSDGNHNTKGWHHGWNSAKMELLETFQNHIIYTEIQSFLYNCKNSKLQRQAGYLLAMKKSSG